MAHDYLELEPVSEAQPAGTDVRYEPEFEQLQAEIDKLSLPSATTAVDWPKVKTLSSDILRTKSKDLLVASYLVIAEIRVNKLEGLATGLSIFAGLLESYWESLFPSQKRMRGRIAAITWLLEKCESAFEDIQGDPVNPDFVLGLREEVHKIDSLLQEYLDDAPLLRPLERIIEELPIEESVESQDLSSPPVEKIEKKAETEEFREDKSVQPRADTIRVDPAPVVSSGDTVSVAEMERIVRGAFQTVRQAADFYFDKDLSNSRGYRCRRIAGWTMIQGLPPATTGQTQVPPPGELEEIRKKLQELRSLEKWQELLKESEQRLHGSLLWLDLNRLSAECLMGLGTQYQEAHDAVCQETAFLLTRLPGLEKLTFADGSPFADAETKQWLESIKSGSEITLQAPASQAGQSSEYMDGVLERAQSMAAAKKVGEAANLLRDEMQRSSSGHERLLWRLGLSQLLINYRHGKLALPHMDEVVRDIESYKIEQWDPALATYALRIVWMCYKSNKLTRDRSEDILARIAKLDPVEAMQLDK